MEGFAQAANKDLVVVSGEMVISEVSSGEVICGQAISDNSIITLYYIQHLLYHSFLHESKLR